jgi:hypothetical protein
MKHFYAHMDFDAEQLHFALGQDRNGKTTVNVTYGPAHADVAMVSAPGVTLWPRCSGDGNFGTMWGPSDVTKAKYTLDLNDTDINGQTNVEFAVFMAKLDLIDDKLLDFVTEHQLKILGRKNLSREEVKMLQIRTVRTKMDKVTGALNGHAINLSISKYASDGIAPGDVCAATMFANMVYTGVGGDKFGIHWGFDAVSVVCQRAALQEQAAEVSAFIGASYDFAKPYEQSSEALPQYDATQQFGTVGA